MSTQVGANSVTQSLSGTTKDIAYLSEAVREVQITNLDTGGTVILWVIVYTAGTAAGALAAADAATDITAEVDEAIPIMPGETRTVFKKNGNPTYVAVDAVGSNTVKFVMSGFKVHVT